MLLKIPCICKRIKCEADLCKIETSFGHGNLKYAFIKLNFNDTRINDNSNY
jgi:hypothetical protein